MKPAIFKGTNNDAKVYVKLKALWPSTMYNALFCPHGKYLVSILPFWADKVVGEGACSNIQLTWLEIQNTLYTNNVTKTHFLASLWKVNNWWLRSVHCQGQKFNQKHQKRTLLCRLNLQFPFVNYSVQVQCVCPGYSISHSLNTQIIIVHVHCTSVIFRRCSTCNNILSIYSTLDIKQQTVAHGTLRLSHMNRYM